MNNDVLNNDEFFADTVPTPKKGVEQHRKLEWLKGAIDRGKVYLLSHKKNNEHMKGLIRLTTKPSIKYMLNTNSVN